MRPLKIGVRASLIGLFGCWGAKWANERNKTKFCVRSVREGVRVTTALPSCPSSGWLRSHCPIWASSDRHCASVHLDLRLLIDGMERLLRDPSGVISVDGLVQYARDGCREVYAAECGLFIRGEDGKLAQHGEALQGGDAEAAAAIAAYAQRPSILADDEN